MDNLSKNSSNPQKPRKPCVSRVNDILSYIKGYHLTNDELKQISQLVLEDIEYSFEYEGKKYSVAKRPPVIETQISSDQAFNHLVLPYMNSHSLGHITNARDLANFLEMSLKLNLIIARNILTQAFEIALNGSKSFIESIVTKQGRAKIKRYFKEHRYEIELGSSQFLLALKKREIDKITQISIGAILLILKLIILLS